MKNNKKGSAPDQVLNTIAEGTVLEGNIITSGEIRIDGRVIGKITCDSKLVIGEKGVVEGNVDARNAYIAGKVEGEVVVRELLQLQQSGRIEGDVYTSKLAVQVGATFTGNCTMGSAAQPMLDKKQDTAADAMRRRKSAKGGPANTGSETVNGTARVGDQAPTRAKA